MAKLKKQKSNRTIEQHNNMIADTETKKEA
jgi:hypothetical protein